MTKMRQKGLFTNPSVLSANFLGFTPYALALCAMLFYLNFNVLRAIRARKMVMIQKRTITLGSAHPFNSK